MTRAELDDALLRFGADLDRWPPKLAESARRLLADDPEAVAILAKFVAFEEAVGDAVRPPSFGAAEIGRILAAVEAEEGAWRPGWRFWAASAGASLLSLAAGAVLVLATLPGRADLDMALAVLGLAAGQGDAGGLL
ncbi:hypothetical protein KXR53_12180 [Inquilinus limosus]|uniref:hypothetical protein n=1 Tax=Inquilinus limosus TaxID=171674 RepID=UPI003F15612D